MYQNAPVFEMIAFFKKKLIVWLQNALRMYFSTLTLISQNFNYKGCVVYKVATDCFVLGE